MDIYDVKTTLFTRAKADELVNYYNQLNNCAGWFYEIIDGNVRQRTYCQYYIRIISPDIKQFDGSHIVGYF